MINPSNRRQSILDFFTLFPAADRDQIARLFFRDNADPAKKATMFVQQLRKEGLIEVNAEKRPYVYFASPLRIKKQSAALDHHLALVDVYITLVESGRPFEIRPEVNFGKGFPRVDLIIRYDDRWYFVEVQRTRIKKRQMQAKIDQYYDLYLYSKHEEICDDFTVMIISDDEYDVNSRIPIMQAKSITEILSI